MWLGIALPLIVLAVVLALVWRWYERTVRAPRRDDAREIPGIRLTAEVLHRLATPPWRVVHEIGDQLPDVDHVIVGPPGVIAVRTRVGERPAPDPLLAGASADALAAHAARCRRHVDVLLAPLPDRCDVLANVYWGTPDPTRPPGDDEIAGAPAVEGQRLTEWLDQLAAATAEPLDATRIDQAWRAVVVGIGRPDPRP